MWRYLIQNQTFQDTQPYWPKDDQYISIAPFKIDHAKTEATKDFTMRTLKLSYKKEVSCVCSNI